MAKISVIIPVLNGAEYIRECIDSIVNQTYSDLEIIPVDAGSTDGTVEILSEYATRDKRIKVLHSDKKSMGHQYNIGISAAEGEYIGFCESDDYLAETMYEKLYSIASEYDLDYVKSDFDMFIDKKERILLNYHILAGKRISLYENVIIPSDYPDIMYRDVNMWNGIYKKEFLQKYKIRLNETPGAAFQDMGFVIQTFLAANKAMYVREDTNRYRRDNIGSSVYDLKAVVNVVWEAEFAEKFMSRLNIENRDIQAVVFQRFCSVFFGFYGKLPSKEYFTDDVKKAINRFIMLAKKVYPSIPYYAADHEGIDQSVYLDAILRNLDEFDTLRRCNEELRRNYIYRFYKHVMDYPKAVIFGAGEMGTSIYAMLRKNDYDKVKCFADNDSDKWGQNIMGCKVVDPAMLAETDHEKTIYIIAMLSHTEEVREQLISLGIDKEDICRAPGIIPHNAMEVEIQK